MSTLEHPSRKTSRTPPRRRRPVIRVALAVLGAVLAFFLGIAFARTLDDRPHKSGNETIVRTLRPLPQQTPGRTVTVTVTATSP